MSTRRQLRLFVDRCVGGKVLKEMLMERGVAVDIVLHDEKFAIDEDDTVWAHWAAGEGRIVLTRDLFRNEYQRRVLADYSGIIVILPTMNTADTVDFLLRSWTKIEHLATQGLTGCFKFSGVTGKLSRRWRN